MTYESNLIRILLFPVLVSITVISCAPYSPDEYNKTPQTRIRNISPIYTNNDRGSVKRDIHAEHYRNLSCGARDGNMDCGRDIGW